MATRTLLERVKIADVARYGSSSAGNPIWTVTLDDGRTFRTKTNASINYGINNPEFVGRPHAGIPVPYVDIALSAAGTIIGVTTSADQSEPHVVDWAWGLALVAGWREDAEGGSDDAEHNAAREMAEWITAQARAVMS